MIKRTSCLDCRSCLIYNTENHSASECFEKLSTLSRGALTQPATDLMRYVSKSFAMLDLCEYIVRQSDLHTKELLQKMYWTLMICHNHFYVTITLKTLSLSTAQFVTSFLIIPKNLSIAKCEEKLYNNSKKGKGSDNTHDWNKTLQLQHCLVLS